MTQNTPKKKNYLNNADLLIEFELSKAQGRMTENFGKMVILLCEKVAKMPKFAGYTYRDDMVGNAIMTITKVWSSFDSTKSKNPFSYYTQVCINAFIQQLNRESNVRDIRDALRIEHGLNASWSYTERHVDEDDIDVAEQYDRQHERDTEDDNTVHDVTEEYVSVMSDAFGQSEPVTENEPVVEEDNSDELIAAYMATVTPTASGSFKTPEPTPTPTTKKRGRRPKIVKEPKPPKIKKEKPPKIVKESNGVVSVKGGRSWQTRLVRDGIHINSLSYHTKEEAVKFYEDYLIELDKGTPLTKIQEVLRSNPIHNYKLRKIPKVLKRPKKEHPYIVNRSNGTYYFKITNSKYKLYSPGFDNIQLAINYRDECLKLIKNNVSVEDIYKHMLSIKKFNSSDYAAMKRMQRNFNDMRHITNKDNPNKYRVVINNRFNKVDKVFNNIDDAKAYRDEMLKNIEI